MAIVETGLGRAQIENLGSEMCITIPMKKRTFIMLFLPVWLAGWAVGMIMVPQQFDKAAAQGQKMFLIVWLVGWTIGGIGALTTLLWNLSGKEIIRASSQNFSIEKSLFGLHLRKEYDRSQIKEWRVIPDADSGSGMNQGRNPWGWSGGTLAFDYGFKTIRCGIFLEEAEARHIIDELKRHGYIRREAAQS